MFPTTSGGYSFTVALADEQATQRLMVDIAALDRARRPDHAVRRSRRRQDHLRPRADPPSRRRRHDRGAEPDLHADADLRAAALHAGACRSLPAVGPGELAELGFDDIARGRRDAAGMARPRRRLSAGRPARRRVHAVAAAGTELPQRARHRLRHVRRARRAHRRDPPLSRPPAALPQAERRRIQGDASTRSYERLTLDGASYILMNSPRRPDGPPVRDGKPYSAIAHLAEDVTPFVAMAAGLRERGFSAPAIFAADRDARPAGDRGSRRRTGGGRRSAGADRGALRGRGRSAGRAARHGAARRVAGRAGRRLLRCRITTWRRMLIEAELLLDWYLPMLDAKLPTPSARPISRCGARRCSPAIEAPPTWVLRDYPFAQSAVAAGARGHRAHRPARFPGRA